MARLRDHPTLEFGENLPETFDACVWLGIDLLPGADHPRFIVPDLYNLALRDRITKVPKGVPLYELLKKATARLRLTELGFTRSFSESCVPRQVSESSGS